jgi:SAM-dependent methyltransferase
MDAESAARAYANYMNFIGRVAPSGGSLLDVGCGNGWSSYLFSTRGYDTTGVDLNAAFFEPQPGPKLCLKEGSVLDLPFPDNSFDVVTAYAMLEHVPDPALALREMLRVVKVGGILCVVGPNLISALHPLRGLCGHAWRNRPLRRIFLRDPAMSRHPGGNTVPENAVAFVRNCLRLISHMISLEPRFEMRQPDLVPPFHADNDACYLCNPFDIVKYLRPRGCELVIDGKPGRPRFTVGLASGTWVAVRKVRSAA